MNTNDNKLALRRQSIRTLTADELRIAHGGVTDSGAGYTTSVGTDPPDRRATGTGTGGAEKGYGFITGKGTGTRGGR